MSFPTQIICQVNNNTYDIAFAQLYQDLHRVLGCPDWYNDFDLNYLGSTICQTNETVSAWKTLNR